MATCTLNGYIIMGSSTGLQGVYVHAVPYDTPSIIEGTDKAISPENVSVLTSSTGYFELELIRNVKFTITIPEIGMRKTIVVPDNAGPVSVWSLTDIYTTGEPDPVDPGADDW